MGFDWLRNDRFELFLWQRVVEKKHTLKVKLKQIFFRNRNKYIAQKNSKTFKSTPFWLSVSQK